MRKAHIIAKAVVIAMVLGLLPLPAPAFAKVGKNSCVGSAACTGNSGQVRNNSCDGVEACADNSGAVRSNACNGHRACADNTGAVGNNACNGDEACEKNTSNTIGNNACDGAGACAGNTGDVGNHACNGDHACYNNTGTIGNNSCNAANACRSNAATIGDNECNAPGGCATACTAPSFDPIADVTVSDNSAPTTIDMTNVIAGPPLAFAVTGNGNPGLVTASFNGDELTLTYTPAMTGTAHITVRLTSCGGLGFAEHTFMVIVTS